MPDIIMDCIANDWDFFDNTTSRRHGYDN